MSFELVLTGNPLASAAVFILCLVVLAKVADSLVDVVVHLAFRLGISEAIAGATLAAAATSAPEFGTTVFSLIAAAQSPAEGAENVGIGTVLGSAVFNLAMIIGVVGLLGGARLEREVVIRDGVAYALSVVALVAALALGPGGLSRVEGLLLLLAYALYVIWIVRDVRAGKEVVQRGEGEASVPRPWLRLLIVIVVIGVACHYLVESTAALARSVADWASVPDARMISIMSLLVVAAGSSLPDLFTSVSALRKGRGSLAVGNAIGSNTFDLLICLGLPYAVLGGHSVAREVILASWYLLLTVIVFLGFLARFRALARAHGLVLLTLYAGFVAFVTRGFWAA